eukprot:3186397-Prymnesium_polylepis.1
MSEPTAVKRKSVFAVSPTRQRPRESSPRDVRLDAREPLVAQLARRLDRTHAIDGRRPVALDVVLLHPRLDIGIADRVELAALRVPHVHVAH